MALKHAVLGLLVPRPNYGHHLVALLQERLGPGFVVDPGTVYASLHNLERAGHVEIVRRVRRGNQMRVYYGITPSGTEHFEDWRDAPLSREPLRSEVFFRFAMTERSQLPALRAAFEHLERECLNEIARCTRVNLADTLPDPVTWDAATGLLLHSGVLDRLTAEHSFIRRVLASVRSAEADGAMPRDMLLKLVEAST